MFLHIIILTNFMNNKVIYICNNLNFFLNTRFNLASKIGKDLKSQIYCLTNLPKKKSKKIKNINFVHLEINNSSLNIFTELKTFLSLYNFIKDKKKNTFHFITIKLIIYGLIISNFLCLKKTVFSFSGLGYFFNTKRNNIYYQIFRIILKIFINHKQRFIFHNKQDFLTISRITNKLKKRNTEITFGSGVNLKLYKKEINNLNINFKILYVGRILYNKGVFDLIDAIKILNTSKNRFKFFIMGDFDEKNPSGIKKIDFFKSIKNIKNINYLSYNKNISSFIYKYSSVIIPSHHEGAPKIILEASASGRLIFASDIAGCRNLIKNNTNGILFKKSDPNNLAKNITKTFKNKKKIELMRKKALIKARKSFSIEKVIEAHKRVYSSL